MARKSKAKVRSDHDKAASLSHPGQALSEEAKQRLWEHAMTEEAIFNSRLNFFLILESVLLGALITFAGSNAVSPKRGIVIHIVLVLGILLTLIWLYTSAKQKQVLDIVRSRAQHELPEYAETLRQITQRRWPINSRTLLTYFIPGVFLVVWGILAAIIA